MKERIKKVIPMLCVFPFIIGTMGYVISGETIMNSLYASFALYFVNPVSDNYNIAIEIARWTAALVTTTVLLYAVRRVWDNLSWWIQCFCQDSAAVYCDSDVSIAFDKKTKVIYPGRRFKPSAKSHIIMLNSDTESLKFYEENKGQLEKKQVYIGLRELEYGLIRDEGGVTFYDISGSIARVLWKQIGVWKRKQQDLSIVIYGNGPLAQNILNYGMLLNLYSQDQHIVYHVISRDNIHRIKHPGLPTGNRDEIRYYLTGDPSVWDKIRQSDIVIISEELSAEMLQTICVNGKNGEVYYYSPNPGDAGDFIQIGSVKPFGRNEDILTDENIRQGKLIERARQLNLQYAEKYNGEKDWGRLSGFLKWSNISSGDFNEVIKELTDLGINKSLESLAELEHIRWCRFHYLNYWVYGDPQNGKSKDADRRIHVCLRDYKDLSEEEKEKDREVVRMAWDSK